MRALVFALLVLLTLAHQDFWWRDDHCTLALGFLPISLAYHIGISIAASLLWGLACVYAWPRGAEVADSEAWSPPTGERGGH